MTVYNLNPDYAILRARGATRIDFLHRMGSGDVLNTRIGEARRSTFITPIGRLVDAVTLITREDECWLLGHAAHQDKLLRWLRKYIFFNDDVQLQPAPELGVWASTESGAVTNGVVALPWPEMGLTRFVGPREVQPAATADAAAFHARRIAAGVPSAPGEISEDFIPLETGLWDHISFKKGCYVGQEIIARMESRNQLARQLCVLSMRGAQPGQSVSKGGLEVGRISSASDTHALAYLRAAAAEIGTILDGDATVVRIVR